MSFFWSTWVVVLTLGSIIGTWWVLHANKVVKEKHQAHEFDGITELDNPMPSWWYWLFIVSIISALGYLLYYPGLGKFKGIGQWSSDKQLLTQQQEIAQKRMNTLGKYSQMPIAQIAKDKKALEAGQRIFANNCSTCHGSSATGQLGYPNLTDNDWLYGGTIQAITHSVTKGRKASMPSWKASLNDKQVNDLVAYIKHGFKAGSVKSENSNLAAQIKAGSNSYKMYCVACHGGSGQGNIMFGAPNLTDNIWLYGGNDEAVKRSIVAGRAGVMPTFEGVLDPLNIRLVTAYVYSLSRNK